MKTLTTAATDLGYDEQELALRIANREEAAIGELYSKYRSMLTGIIMKVVHDSAECEDILQDVLLQVWDRISTFEPAKGRFSCWLSTLARRRAIDHVRKICAYRRASDRFELDCKHNKVGFALTQDVDENDVRSLIDRQLDLLPDQQKEVIRLSFLEGRSQREIASLTHTPLGTVKTRIELGLKKLGRALSDCRSQVL